MCAATGRNYIMHFQHGSLPKRLKVASRLGTHMQETPCSPCATKHAYQKLGLGQGMQAERLGNLVDVLPILGCQVCK